MTVSLTSVLTKSTDQLSTEIGAETLMMRVENGRYYSVDGPAQAIWDLIDGQRTVADIIQDLTDTYDVDAATCKSDTLDFAQALAKEELVTVQG